MDELQRDVLRCLAAMTPAFSEHQMSLIATQAMSALNSGMDEEQIKEAIETTADGHRRIALTAVYRCMTQGHLY